MNYAKAIYHRIVPARIRNPIGLIRREVTDRVRRMFARTPLPPRQLLANIQMTPWAFEYLGVGKRSAESILHQLTLSGIAKSTPIRLLDFGCGSGRILRYLKSPAWELHGCDVDQDAITWSGKALGFVKLEVCSPSPPLPYPDSSFDVVITVSVFTHFSEEEQQVWRDELARVIKPGGLLLLSTMGASVLGNFPGFNTEPNRARLSADGSLFFRKSGAFNASAAFHTPRAIAELFEPRLFLQRWYQQGLDGFQDLSVLRRVERGQV